MEPAPADGPSSLPERLLAIPLVTGRRVSETPTPRATHPGCFVCLPNPAVCGPADDLLRPPERPSPLPPADARRPIPPLSPVELSHTSAANEHGLPHASTKEYCKSEA